MTYIAFRIECPHCKWGVPWKDKYVNMGWREIVCNHCHNIFYTKITIDNIRVETQPTRPECMT
jgi:hypothetical protein